MEALQEQLSVDIDINYTEQTKQLALIPVVMSVDKELEPEVLTKQFIQRQNGFTIRVKSRDPKKLRAVVGGIFRHMGLVVNTIQQFGDV